MKWISENIIPIISVVICLVASWLVSCFVDFSNSDIINYSFITNMVITLFSVSLAIVALMITILDKYKDKTDNKTWAIDGTNILRELSSNTLSHLVMLIILIICSTVSSPVDIIPKVDVHEFVLLFVMFLTLLTICDTTISVHKLVLGLKSDLSNDDEILLSQTERHLIEAYRFLDKANKRNLEETLSALALKQQVKRPKD